MRIWLWKRIVEGAISQNEAKIICHINRLAFRVARSSALGAGKSLSARGMPQQSKQLGIYPEGDWDDFTAVHRN